MLGPMEILILVALLLVGGAAVVVVVALAAVRRRAARLARPAPQETARQEHPPVGPGHQPQQQQPYQPGRPYEPGQPDERGQPDREPAGYDERPGHFDPDRKRAED
ncbi:MAG: hypothetical protein L0G99_11050 [Propionibacteriales bacterium]|nr:hypothetical protein [Propionibacteriales bacterium]